MGVQVFKCIGVQVYKCMGVQVCKYMFDLFFIKDDSLFFQIKFSVFMGAPQENDANFRFAIYPQGIWHFHDNCQIVKCQTVATLVPV